MKRMIIGITVDFWEYIKNNYEDLIENDYSNDYPFTNLFKMVKSPYKVQKTKNNN